MANTKCYTAGIFAWLSLKVHITRSGVSPALLVFITFDFLLNTELIYKTCWGSSTWQVTLRRE